VKNGIRTALGAAATIVFLVPGLTASLTARGPENARAKARAYNTHDARAYSPQVTPGLKPGPTSANATPGLKAGPTPPTKAGPTTSASQTMNLPKTVGAWTRADTPRTIDKRTIFDYMDGAGELYMAYGFTKLDAYEYKAASAASILVEIYWMENPGGPFGLMSTDWGGESVSLGRPAPPAADVWQRRALYGAGLLRLASDTVYARVMATRETPESRKAVLELGRAIVSGRRATPTPALMTALPSTLGKYQLRKDRTCFLRSHLVLNSQYFVSSEDILDFGQATDAVVAPLEPQPAGKGAKRATLLIVRYAEEAQAQKALDHFLRAYLQQTTPSGPPKTTGTAKIEDGWLGYQRNGRTLAVVFESPDQATATTLTDAAARAWSSSR
jgi:hypothetical protein